MMESIEKLRESLKDCTSEAGVESNRFDTYWITARACDMLIDEIEREIAEKYMLLPVDADGVPIHVGDEVQFRNDAPVRVDSIGTSRVYENDWGFFASNGGFLGQGTLCNVHHVKPRTVEDVLAEVENGELSIEDAAAEIRDLLGGDAR